MRLLRRAAARVEVVSTDESWAARFESERGELESLLAPWLEAGVHHVGSTAVPGLAARPIVDVLAGVSPATACREAATALRGAGWRVHGELPDGGIQLRKRSPEGWAYQLDLLPVSSSRYEERLELRQALRDDPQLAEAFSVLQRELAARAPQDDRGFTEAKAGFITGILRAREESRRSDTEPASR